jgi:hypothetical protein
MQRMIQNCWSRLSDVARLARRGEDDSGGNRDGISRITGSLTSSHPLTLRSTLTTDRRKNLDQVDAGVGRLEAMALTESFQIPATGMFRHLVQTVTLPGAWRGESATGGDVQR